jgi:hypothetical protein
MLHEERAIFFFATADVRFLLARLKYFSCIYFLFCYTSINAVFDSSPQALLA